MNMKRWAALLTALMLMIPFSGMADQSVSWLYSFSAGEALAGEKMDGVREFLDAVQLELVSVSTGDGMMGQAVLLSYGKPVITLRAAASEAEEGTVGIYCSLLGNCTLMCRRDQIPDFLNTLVQMLADLNILKEENLAQVGSLAARAGNLIIRVLDRQSTADPALGMNLNPYLDKLSGQASSEAIGLEEANPECAGAVLKRVWHLSEAELNDLVNAGIQKAQRIPILGDALRESGLQIGSSTVTVDSLQQMLASVHGETTLEVFYDPEEKPLLLKLMIPDLAELTEDPELRKIRGAELAVTRSVSEADGKEISETSIGLIGLEGRLMTVRMEKGSGKQLDPLPTETVYQVGEMDSEALWDMLQGMSLTLASNMLNLIMDMPRVVFDTLMNRLF